MNILTLLIYVSLYKKHHVKNMLVLLLMNTFNEHINYISSLIRFLFLWLKLLKYYVMNINCLKMVYFALAQSILPYGIVVCGSMNKYCLLHTCYNYLIYIFFRKFNVNLSHLKTMNKNLFKKLLNKYLYVISFILCYIMLLMN